MSGVAHPLGHCTCERHSDRPWNRPEHWTLEEVNYLEARYGRSSDEAIARHLGRSVLGIRLKAKRLGFHKRDVGMSSREVGQQLGVDETTVSKVWIRRGLLHARRGYEIGGRRRRWIVQERDVERFIREHGQWVDPDKVPEWSPFKALALANRWVSLVEVGQATGHSPDWLAWYCRGLIPSRRKGTHRYIPAGYVDKLPRRDPDALEYSRFVRAEMLQRRNDRRKGIAA